MAEESSEMKMVKAMLRSVLMSCKEGVPAAILQKDYRDVVGDFLPYKKLGYPNIEQFIMSIPDVVRVDRRGGEYIFHAVADEATAHIHSMVKKQRSRKLKKPVRRPRGGGGAWFVHGSRPSYPRKPATRPTPAHAGPRGPRHGIPSFVSTPQPRPMPQVVIQVGNSTGTRTVRVQPSHLLNKAMHEANTDRTTFSDPQRDNRSRFELPPRFRKTAEAPEHQHVSMPSRRPPTRTEFAKIDDGDVYLKQLSQYLKEINHPLNFETTAAAGGYASSITINQSTYGSEDIFRTARDAELAVAKVAMSRLDHQQCPQESRLPEIDWNDTTSYHGVGNWADEVTSPGVRTVTILPPDKVRVMKARVKDILQNKKNGLWGTRIPHEYKEKYKEEPPADLLQMVKTWSDIARVEFVPNTDRDIVYPVFDDVSMNANKIGDGQDRPKDQIQKIVGPTKVGQASEGLAKVGPTQVGLPAGPAVIDSPIRTEGVKDLYALYIETKDRQYNMMKNLAIPKESLIKLGEEVVIYLTYVYNPGYFCVQRGDSNVDSIAEQLQNHCKLASSPDPKVLQKGQYCAGIYSGDGNWTRAQILEIINQDSVQLLFVDYGNVETVKIEAIRWLSVDLASHPAQAINCSLYGVQPLEGETEWSSKAGKMFAKEVEEKAVLGVPRCFYDGDLVDIELYLKSDTSVSISDKLIKAGLVRGVASKEAEPGLPEDKKLHPDDIMLPDDKEWDVHITYISNNTNSVMLRLVGEEYSERLDAFQAQLETAFRNTHSEAPIREGATYVAFDDELYHRVRVISKTDRKVLCYFLDHGDTDDLLPEQLLPLDPAVNRKLPYQAVEVSLYGLEEVATNITALERMCHLALGKTCVAQIVERDDVPSVILYDTSSEIDININDNILKTIKAEGGGIDSPRTLSPAPGPSSTTPKRVLSPVPSANDIKTSVNTVTPNLTSDSVVTEPSDKSISNVGQNSHLSTEKLASKTNSDSYSNKTLGASPSSKDTSENSGSVLKDVSKQKLSSPYIPPPPPAETPPSSPYKSTMMACARTPEVPDICDMLKETQIAKKLNLDSKDSNTEELSSKTYELKSADTSDMNAFGSSGATGISDLDLQTDNVSASSFPIPEVGDCLDVHVNFIHDPSNFVCLPYSEMHSLNKLLLDMMDYYNANAQTMNQDDVKIGQLYAGYKDSIWYRIRVTQFVGTDLVTVYLADIGEYSVMMISELQPLQPRFCKLPLMAISARLGRIKPDSGSWYEAAKYKFIELAREKDLIGLVLKHDKDTGVVDLNLIDTTNDDFDICIDEVLVKMGFAKFS